MRRAPDPRFAGADAADPTAGEKRRNLGNRGKEWERTINAIHAVYLQRGISVWKNPPAMAIGRSLGKGRFAASFAAEGPPDYTIQAFGVAILLEAKSIRDDRLPLARIEPHQAERMTRHEAHEGRALVLASLDGAVWFLPWATLGPLWTAHANRTGRAASGEASIGPDVLGIIGFQLRDADWLQTALTLWRRIG